MIGFCDLPWHPTVVIYDRRFDGDPAERICPRCGYPVPYWGRYKANVKEALRMLNDEN